MRKPAPIIAIFLTVLIDMLSFGMAIPDLQLRGASLGATGWVLGLMLASFSIAQLLVSPYLGQLSDRIGRRKVLIVTCTLTFLCFVLYAHATVLWILFAARIIAGISSANIGVAFAYIADVTTPKDRAKGMGLVGAAFGIGFIMGPPAGAFLVQAGGGTPLLLGYSAAALALVNLFFVWKFLPDVRNTATEEIQVSTGKRENPFVTNWKSVLKALETRELRILIVLFFGSTFAFSNLEATFFRLLEGRWMMTQVEGAAILAWVGIIAAFVQGYLIRILIPRLGEPNLMRIGYLLQVPVLISIPFTPPWIPLMIGAMLLGLGTGVASPATSSMISRSAPSHLQGSIFGISQSVGAFGRILGPLCGSVLYDIDPASPYICAAIVMLIPALLAFSVRMPDGGNDGEIVPAH